MNGREFNSAKGAFFLVAGIIATMMVMLVLGMGTCTYLAIAGAPMPVCSDLKEFARELITMASRLRSPLPAVACRRRQRR